MFRTADKIARREMGLWLAVAVMGSSSFLAQQASTEPTVPGSWVPIVATLTQTNRANFSGVSANLETSGVYARDSHGRSFNRRTVTSAHASLPFYGPGDIASLVDLPNQAIYTIDYSAKKISRETPKSIDWDAVAKPLSREQFTRKREGDEFLGKMVVSGLACEGYRLAKPHRKGWHDVEEWYAPSLDFFGVKSHGHRSDGSEVSTLLTNIQAGQEPDAKYFRLPESFKLVK